MLCQQSAGTWVEADTKEAAVGVGITAATLEGGMVLNWPTDPLRHRILVFGGLTGAKRMVLEQRSTIRRRSG